MSKALGVWSRLKAAAAAGLGAASSVPMGGGWFPLIREAFTGAWQRNMETQARDVLAAPVVFACVLQLSNDIGKLRYKLLMRGSAGMWEETTSPAFSPVLRRPNSFQNHVQFKQWWMVSKLTNGNVYVLKVRDNRNVVTSLIVLDPMRVTPLVTPMGDVYYRLSPDPLSQVTETITVPATEIIHDRMNCLWHPLVGVSPLYAAAAAAGVTITIQENSARFFGNSSQPGGILVAPGAISEENARELKEYWATNYTGANAGRVAVLGDGLKYEQMRMSSTDAQLMEQLKWSDERVCTAFGVPAYKVGVGAVPAYTNIESLDRKYYSDCLQVRIEEMETALDDGLGLDGVTMGVELDVDNLWRMDSKTLVESLKLGVDGAIYTPNEARARVNLKPLPGGDSVYMQQQNWSLKQLSERDSAELNKPTAASAAPSIEPAGEPAPEDTAASDEKAAAAVREFLEYVQKGLACEPN